MSTRAKQAVIIGLGLVVAAVMIFLGLWQMNRYRLSMEDVAAERAAQEPVDLVSNINPDGSLADIYGRRVTASGSFGQERLLVGTTWPMREVVSFTTDDGRTLPVVVGLVQPGQHATVPAGHREVVGILTATDASGGEVPADAPTGSLPTLRLQALVQSWPQPMVAGYITLLPDGAAKLGVEPAAALLPEQHGSAMHQGYALQWWVFAIGAVAGSIVVALGLDKPRGRRRTSVS